MVTESTNRFAIIVGHSNDAQGAKNYRHETEYVFNTRIAYQIKDFIDKHYNYNPLKKTLSCQIFSRDNGWDKLSSNIREFGPQLSIELHFNAFHKPAFGCEVLVYNQSPDLSRSVLFADRLTDRLATKFKIKQRHTYALNDDSETTDGVFVMSKGRGVHNLKVVHGAGVPNVLLLEPVFGTFEHKESKAIFENEKEYAETVALSVSQDFYRLPHDQLYTMTKMSDGFLFTNVS